MKGEWSASKNFEIREMRPFCESQAIIVVHVEWSIGSHPKETFLSCEGASQRAALYVLLCVSGSSALTSSFAAMMSPVSWLSLLGHWINQWLITNGSYTYPLEPVFTRGSLYFCTGPAPGPHNAAFITSCCKCNEALLKVWVERNSCKLWGRTDNGS